jgi:hypothetical protein
VATWRERERERERSKQGAKRGKKRDCTRAELGAGLELEAIHSGAAVQEPPKLFLVFAAKSDGPLIPQQAGPGSRVQDSRDYRKRDHSRRKHAGVRRPVVPLGEAQTSLQDEEYVGHDQPESDLRF